MTSCPKGKKSSASKEKLFVELRASGCPKPGHGTSWGAGEGVPERKGSLLPGSSMGVAPVLHESDIEKKEIRND